jgi:hypothetical protein
MKFTPDPELSLTRDNSRDNRNNNRKSPGRSAWPPARLARASHALAYCGLTKKTTQRKGSGLAHERRLARFHGARPTAASFFS